MWYPHLDQTDIIQSFFFNICFCLWFFPATFCLQLFVAFPQRTPMNKNNSFPSRRTHQCSHLILNSALIFDHMSNGHETYLIFIHSCQTNALFSLRIKEKRLIYRRKARGFFQFAKMHSKSFAIRKLRNFWLHPSSMTVIVNEKKHLMSWWTT